MIHGALWQEKETVIVTALCPLDLWRGAFLKIKGLYMAETKNQTEGEFFAVVETGRRGLESMAEKMGGELMSIAAKSVTEAGPAWLKRAVVFIANNESLAPVLQTKTGLFSVYKALTKAAVMGLQIGGQFPQAHLIPYGGKAELIVSAEGYKHAAVNGPGAVLSSCEIRRVYDGDDVRIDIGAGKVDHVIDVTKERGKLIGVYGIMRRLDGTTCVDWMTASEALSVRDAHSTAWKNNRPTPWKSDPEAMIEKTAAKKFLRRYAAEAEGLAMLFGQDSDEPAEEYTPPPRDVSERMAARLDRKAAAVDSEPRNVTPPKPEPEAAPQPEPTPEPETAEAPGVELF